MYDIITLVQLYVVAYNSIRYYEAWRFIIIRLIIVCPEMYATLQLVDFEIKKS